MNTLVYLELNPSFRILGCLKNKTFNDKTESTAQCCYILDVVESG